MSVPSEPYPRQGLTGVRVGGAVVLAWLVLAVVVLLPGAPPPWAVELALPLTTCASAAAVLLRAWVSPEARRSWALLGLGLSGYGLGFVVLFHVSTGEGAVFGLNASDAVSLLLYPLGYAGLLGLSRAAGARLKKASVLDAGVVLLASAALALTWVGVATPRLLDGSPLQVVYALAYPVGGFTLLVVCLSGLVASRALWDPTWSLLALALALMTLGDAVYGVRSAAGTFGFGTWLDLVYTAGPTGLALAAWQRRESGARAQGQWPAVMLPTVSGLVVLLLLAFDHWFPMPGAAVGLAVAAGVLSVLRTATSLRQEHLLEKTLREVATDPITGLRTRGALLRQMALGDDLRPQTLLVVDLDGLDEVRDSLGAVVADEVLARVGARVRPLVPEGCAGRLRASNFGLLVPATGEAAQAVARALREAVELPVEVGGHRLVLRGAVGGAHRPAGGEETEWLRRSDVALRAARGGATRTALHDDGMDTTALQRLARLSELRTALTDGPEQLVVHYQGKHDPRDGRLHSAEALIRWQHPREGLLGPGAFLGLAEEAGLLSQVTRHVLDTVLTDAVAVRRTRPDWQVSVNICADDLLDPSFVGHVRDLLVAHALPPDVLRLEVTETVVMSDPERVLVTLKLLAGLGLGLSLDDYGTGLASLAYLRLLPVDELKIDRSFVTDLLQRRDDELIVSSTVQLAHGLGLTVVAEGAEDTDTVRRLHELDCDDVQGFALSRPVRLAQLLAEEGAALRTAV